MILNFLYPIPGFMYNNSRHENISSICRTKKKQEIIDEYNAYDTLNPQQEAVLYIQRGRF